MDSLETQHGAALLLVLSILLLISAMAFTSLYHWSDLYNLFKISEIRKSQKWILLEIEGEMLNRIIGPLLNSKYIGDELGHSLTHPKTIKINENDIYYNLVDRTNCLNIYSIKYKSCNNTVESYARTVFKNMLINSGGGKEEINNIMEYISGFINRDCCENNKYNIYTGSILRPKYTNSNDDLAVFLPDYSNKLLLQLTPLICTRNDNVLLVNINTLEIQHAKLVQAMLMNTLSEEDIVRIILSKPATGWGNVESFFDSMLNNSVVAINDRQKIRDISMSNFATDEYFISLSFGLDGKDEYYQLSNFLHIKKKQVTVLQRMYGIGEPYNE